MPKKLLTGDTVKNSLIYVERREDDAGLVFITDVSSAKPGTLEVITTYLLAHLLLTP